MLTADEVMHRCRLAYERSSLTLGEIGRRMGYDKNPRAAAWQFLYLTHSPKVTTLLRFARAVRVPPARLLAPRRRRASMPA